MSYDFRKFNYNLTDEFFLRFGRHWILKSKTSLIFEKTLTPWKESYDQPR